MDISSVSRDKIKAGLERASSNTEKTQHQSRLLFTPQRITEENFDSVCKTYAQIGPADFRTVVVVESTPGEAEKKLAMPSFKTVQNHLGEVKANVKLRNDFADEDDDFFIDDNAFDEQSSLYQQLPLLQCALEEFTVLHIQITNENPPILKELAMALQEILPSWNALLVCCCDLGDQYEVDQVTEFLGDENFSGLMNRLNRDESKIDGLGAFVAGLLVSKKWGLNIYFEPDAGSGVVQSGYAGVHNQPIFG